MEHSLIELYQAMGLFAKSVVWTLALMSVFSLAIAVLRYVDLLRSRRATIRFAPLLDEALTNHDFEVGVNAVRKYHRSHLAQSYAGIFEAIRQHVEDGTLTAVEVASAQRSLELNKLGQLARFRRGLGVLATVGATAPFVGLLGTTMGVVHSFQGMATAGSAGLGAVSAGIAEALITTAFGLFVAIPAVWLYNYMTNRVEFIAMEIDYGSKEFMNFMLYLEARLQRGEKIVTMRPVEAEAAPQGA